MKTMCVFLILLLSVSLNAQKVLDTLYVNNKKNVALFFPNTIRQGITGAPHFIFTYNREKKQYFGLLQAQPGEESNLLVVTDDRSVYSYILKYSLEISQLNYFISQTESIGNEMQIPLKPKLTKKSLDSTKRRLEYHRRFGESLLKLKPKRLKTERKKGIKLQLQRIVYNDSETYLIMEISNNSGITFEVDYLNVYRISGNKKRKASYQKLFIESLSQYKLPDKIRNGQSYRFVYVLPKFVLGYKEKLQLELQEFNGSRKMVLK